MSTETQQPPTVFLLSGQARTFAKCLPSQHWHVYRKFTNLHFYVSVADDADAPAMELLRAKYPTAVIHIERVKQPDLKEPDPKLAEFAPYAISSPIQGILKQLWHLSRVWKFAKECGMPEDTRVFRMRPDLHFHAFGHNLRETFDFNFVDGDKWARTPYWGGYGGCNDRFALMNGAQSARAYFEAYDVLPSLLAAGCPLHPESIIRASLAGDGVFHKATLDAEFSALRPDGKLVHMVVLPSEIAAFSAHLASIK